MQNENCFLLLVIKEAAVLFCTCQINHILILANIPQNPLSYAEFSTEIYMEKKGKKNARAIHQYWSLCRNAPYISKKGMRIKHGPWNFFSLESFLDRTNCRLCYGHLFSHNTWPFEARWTRNLKQRTFGRGGKENGISPQSHGKWETQIKLTFQTQVCVDIIKFHLFSLHLKWIHLSDYQAIYYRNSVFCCHLNLLNTFTPWKTASLT